MRYLSSLPGLKKVLGTGLRQEFLIFAGMVVNSKFSWFFSNFGMNRKI